jgi:hypothetical protein
MDAYACSACSVVPADELKDHSSTRFVDMTKIAADDDRLHKLAAWRGEFVDRKPKPQQTKDRKLAA